MWLRPNPRLRTDRVLLPAPRRPLSAEEIELAIAVFGPRLDLRPVRITRDHLFAWHAPIALGNTVHLKTDWGHFGECGLRLSAHGLRTLVHELCHVWQYQNGGRAYIAESSAAQALAWLRTRDRGTAYDWQAALGSGRPWRRWNPEQQASAVESWAMANRRRELGEASARDHQLLAALSPMIRAVREGRGAVSFSPTGAVIGAGGGALVAGLAQVLLGLSPLWAGLLALAGGMVAGGWPRPGQRKERKSWVWGGGRRKSGRD